MTEKSLYSTFNDIQNSDEDLKKFDKPIPQESKLLFYRYAAGTEVSFQTLRPQIENYLDADEKIQFYMAVRDPASQLAQMGFAMFSGVGMLPFLSSGVSNIIVVTQRRLVQVALQFNLTIDRFVSYPFEALDKVYTGNIDGKYGRLTLFLSFKNKHKVKCSFVGRHMDYQKLAEVLDTLPQAQHLNPAAGNTVDGESVEQVLQMQRKTLLLSYLLLILLLVVLVAVPIASHIMQLLS